MQAPRFLYAIQWRDRVRPECCGIEWCRTERGIAGITFTSLDMAERMAAELEPRHETRILVWKLQEADDAR